MKTVWSIVAKLLLVVVLVQGWFLYDFHQKNQLLITDNLVLEQQLLSTKEALELAQLRSQELEKRSLDGMLKETNKAVVSGWQALMDSVEKELDKARQAIPEIIGEVPEEPMEDIEPDFQSPKRQNESTQEHPQQTPSVIGERT